ncbi:hypothetical protein M3Y98_00571700 [Aphelenchoides besseyi]|nr:hypothetical protein M3Y98_00571700 [Aphelenchoides besseyi]
MDLLHIHALTYEVETKRHRDISAVTHRRNELEKREVEQSALCPKVWVSFWILLHFAQTTT